jgi:beta-phosphoglucomutase-like phosphatase (HAD superfamily)
VLCRRHSYSTLDGTVVVTRDQVRHAKPDPDLFVTAAELGVRAID